MPPQRPRPRPRPKATRAIHGLECGITSHASGPPILVFGLPFFTQSLPSKNIIPINWINDSVGHGKI